MEIGEIATGPTDPNIGEMYFTVGYSYPTDMPQNSIRFSGGKRSDSERSRAILRRPTAYDWIYPERG
ncbi:hypothetical protein DK316_21480 [Mycobacterium tuberculosis]|nr:hypothetical protein DK316_21480 [Mycobacterium tuberculosis]CPR39902.1 Uncharacterised protein [Mycobacteroides abscessus]SIC29315.1 Uncharacterised protein [Mycobacteroides abscessus subsp. abscessus]CPW21307.1 Uncharacterised protein [Mycobacteroides abscessus]CPZ27782.1 Uncharacterised protein [Mycobacteroides abscessus]